MGATRSRFSEAAACGEAVGDLLADRGITDRGIDPPLHDIDGVGMYFRKD